MRMARKQENTDTQNNKTMRILLISTLLSLALMACSNNIADKKFQFSNGMTISVPSGMTELKEYDSLPQYLVPLFDFDTKEGKYSSGNGSYFSSIIVNAQVENIEKQCRGYFDQLSGIFTETYPFRNIFTSSTFNYHGNDYYYEVFKLEFSFATYSVFYALSDLDGDLLYVILLEQTDEIEKMEKCGFGILKSIQNI